MAQKYMRYGILALAMLMLTADFSLADTTDLLGVEDERIIELSAGYRFVDTDNNPNRAAEYSYLNDSPTFDFLVKKYDKNRKFSLVGEYLGHEDYTFNGSFDTNLLRMNARVERMYHNLDHIPYDDQAPESRQPIPPYFPFYPDEGLAYYSDLAPGKDYGRSVSTSEIKLRGKVPNYPAHINLSYWRLERKGDMQLRFVDENCLASCHMQSTTRKINRVTEEVTAGIDAHLGPVDIAFLQTLREFREKDSDPSDYFEDHANFGGGLGPLFRPAGQYDHDRAPDSKLVESTFKINLPPSGGFVSSASYTIGTRENDSDYPGLSSDEPETDYQKLAADVTYTPGEKWTVNFRYRMLELDSDNPTTQTSGWSTAGAPGFDLGQFGSEAPVRQSIDIDRNNYAATVSYRPTRRLTIKGDYEREDTDRNNTGVDYFSSGVIGPLNPNLVWDVPSNETIDRVRLSLFSRHLEKSALKLNGWYEYKHVDDPAYGTSLSESNELFLSASYRSSAIWGATGSIDILRGENDDRTYTQFDTNLEKVEFDLDRDEERENLAIGLWVIPNSIVSADLNYGWLHSKIEQDTLYGQGPDPDDPTNNFSFVDDDSDFEQRVHTISAGLNLRILENLNCRVEGYHIRSSSKFSNGISQDDAPNLNSPYLPDEPSINSPGDLEDISEVDIRQNGFKSRITWQFTRMLQAQFEYTYDDYDDKDSDVFDGSVQTFIASLGGSF